MAAIYPIPTGRSSDTLLKSRLLMQLAAQNQGLLHVQQQLSTGRRVLLPSEDAPAATRAMTLQRQLELKAQVQINLNTTESYLNATDTALGGVTDLLNNVRGLAVRAADSTTSRLEREAIVVEVEEAIDRMLTVGNETFRDRYLFGGSQAGTSPFQVLDGYVAYAGNDAVLRSYADSSLLFDTNVPAQELFGAVSAEMRGIDLNPILTADTRLTDLRSGLGIATGSFEISDGTNSRTLDISAAWTIGDVARLLEANPPGGREVVATVTPTGLHVSIDEAGGGSLVIRDLAGGSTARDLGIARSSGSASSPIVGADLDPILRLTTPVQDLVGVRARAILRGPGPHNDILLEARNRGAEYNDYTLQLVDDRLLQVAPGLTRGQERAELHTTAVAARAAVPLSGFGNDLLVTAVEPGTEWNEVTIRLETAAGLGNAASVAYNAADRVLTLTVDDADQTTVGTLVNAIDVSGLFTAAGDTSLGETLDPTAAVQAIDAGNRGNTGHSGGGPNTVFVYIEPGRSSASRVVAALQNAPEVNALFAARVYGPDSAEAPLAGSRPVDVDATATTAYGAGANWDQESGLQIRQDQVVHAIDVTEVETVEDLLNVLNGSDAMVLAEINKAGNGINLRSRLSGADFAVGENGGTTASQLGLRSLTAETLLSSLNFGTGVHTGEGADLVIQRNDGTDLEVDLSSARTLGDVVDLINNHPDNQDLATAVTAAVRPFGNGLQLEDDNPTGEATLSIRVPDGRFAAWDLGLVPRGAWVSSPADVTAGTPATGSIALPPPDQLNTSLSLTSVQAGTAQNDVQLVFVHNVASGDQALVAYDPLGKTLTVDVDPLATTANAVLAAINSEGTFTATLDTSLDPTNNGTGVMTRLGVLGVTAGGTADVLTGQDTNPLEVHGIFNSLIRLRDALAEYDVEQLQRVVDLFDRDFDRLNVGRAVLGTQGQTLEVIQNRHVNETVELQRVLSAEIDVDMAEAVSNFAAQQTAFEATLQSMGRLFQLSLLDFI